LFPSFLGKGKGGVKWERGQVGEESEKEKGMKWREMGMHEKNSPKTQHIWHLGTPLELPAYYPVYT